MRAVRPVAPLAGTLAMLALAASAQGQVRRSVPRIPEPAPPAGLSALRAAPGERAFPAPDSLSAPRLLGRRLPPGALAPAAFLASALVPGAGQYLLSQDRWVPYLAGELFGWWEYRRHRRAGRSFERQYRDLAWKVARRVSVGVRHDSVFEYYETIEHWPASGSYDADPRQPGIDPETDTTTFNGQQWLLAKRLFFGDVARPPGSIQYQQALAYYEANAIPAGYAWAWGDNLLEQRSFGELIHRGDDHFRAASRVLGLILANHVLSAVDGFISARIRAAQPTAPRIRIEHGFEPLGPGFRYTAEVLVPWPER